MAQMIDEMKLPIGLYERADRAAQLVESVLDSAREAKDPSLASYGTIGQILAMVRDRYPEGADRVWRYSVQVNVSSPAPDITLFNESGKYLFVPPASRTRPDFEYASNARFAGRSMVNDFRAIRYSTNPELIETYVDALLKLSDTSGPNYDAAVAYSLAFQLIPKARDLELNDVEKLERLLATLPASSGGEGVALLGGSPADPEAGEPGVRRDRAIRQSLRAAARGRIEEARTLAGGIDDSRVRNQVAVLIAFADAREAIGKKDWQGAATLTNLVPSGVKRALLYAGVIAGAPRDLALQEVGLQVRDAEPLPAEFRIALFSAAAQAMLPTDDEQALLLLTQGVKAANDLQSRNLESRFDPAQRLAARDRGPAANTDVPLIALGQSLLQEAVDSRVGRHYFPLTVPGVSALNLPVAFVAARDLDYRRLEAVALNLRDERRQAEVLLAIAASQLQP